MRNEVLHRVNQKGNIIQTISRKRANRIGQILRRNCLLKHFIEGKIEGGIEATGRRGRRCKELLNDLKGKERILEIERRNSGSQSVQNFLGRRLWGCRKRDDRVNET